MKIGLHAAYLKKFGIFSMPLYIKRNKNEKRMRESLQWLTVSYGSKLWSLVICPGTFEDIYSFEKYTK